VTKALTQPGNDSKTIKQLLTQQVLAYRKVGKNNTPENTKMLIQDASQGLQEIKEIVDSLTNFSHVQDTPAVEIDVNETLQKALKMTEKSLDGRKVLVNLANQLPKVKGIPNQLIQVFTNIITNATHATDRDSGVLTVKTRLINNSVLIMFKDNGRGMDDESLSKAFDPFYTTKEVGEGTGLGLSISYRIVETHGGKLSIESQENVGTTVVVELPL
jgi:signal transduction histidine kinase